MNAPARAPGAWDRVEKTASLYLQWTLLVVIGGRLIFADWWPMLPLDFVISAVAVALLLISLRFTARRRAWRLTVLGYAVATQIVPMVWREPILLVPVLGGLIPVVVILWALLALSNKGRPQP